MLGPLVALSHAKSEDGLGSLSFDYNSEGGPRVRNFHFHLRLVFSAKVTNHASTTLQPSLEFRRTDHLRMYQWKLNQRGLFFSTPEGVWICSRASFWWTQQKLASQQSLWLCPASIFSSPAVRTMLLTILGRNTKLFATVMDLRKFLFFMEASSPMSLAGNQELFVWL